MWSLRRALPRMAAILIAVLGGCSASPKPLTYFGHADLEYYKGLSTKIDYPSRPDPDNPGAIASHEPPLLRHPRKDQLWDMSLGQAIHIALKNNKIIRTRDQFELAAEPAGHESRTDSVGLRSGPARNGHSLRSAGRGSGPLRFRCHVLHQLDVERQHRWSKTTRPDGRAVDQRPADLDPGHGPVQARGSTRSSPIRASSRSSTNGTTRRTTSRATCFPRSTRALCGPNSAGRCLPAAAPITPGSPDRSARTRPAWRQGVVISRINSDIAIADFEATVHQLIRDVQSSVLGPVAGLSHVCHRR